MPLGTAAPITVKGNIHLSELGVRVLNWHEVIGEANIAWWNQYVYTMQQLQDVEFHRGLFPNEEKIVQTKLQRFADASKEVCAAMCYIRHHYEDGSVVMRNLKAAKKLDPLKTVSVCKLEINAALLGARLARFAGNALTSKISARYFWQESSTVRNWVGGVWAQ